MLRFAELKPSHMRRLRRSGTIVAVLLFGILLVLIFIAFHLRFHKPEIHHHHYNKDEKESIAMMAPMPMQQDYDGGYDDEKIPNNALHYQEQQLNEIGNDYQQGPQIHNGIMNEGMIMPPMNEAVMAMDQDAGFDDDYHKDYPADYHNYMVAAHGHYAYEDGAGHHPAAGAVHNY